MSGNDEKSSEKTENFENIDPSEVPSQGQQQPLQVGSYMERSYSADELEEPMKVYPRTSERANEGQELTVRKRLMLTETEESTLDEQRDVSQQPVETGGSVRDTAMSSNQPRNTSASGVSREVAPKITASPVESPSPVNVSNKLGDDVGDNQDFSVVSSPGAHDAVNSPQISNTSAQEIQAVPIVPGAAGAVDSEIKRSLSNDEPQPQDGKGLDVLDAKAPGSNDTFGPTENSQKPSTHKDVTVPQNTVPSSFVNSDNDGLAAAEMDRGASKDGTHGPSEAQPNNDSEMYNDFQVMDSGHKAGAASGSGGQGSSKSGARSNNHGNKLHPIENSRQKWELTGGAEEEDMDLADENGANAVAIAPMRMSMTNESEIEVQSLEVDPETGNNDKELGLQEAEEPNVDVQSLKSVGKPEDVIYQEAEEALECPSQLSGDERNATMEPSDEPGNLDATSGNIPVDRQSSPGQSADRQPSQEEERNDLLEPTDEPADRDATGSPVDRQSSPGQNADRGSSQGEERNITLEPSDEPADQEATGSPNVEEASLTPVDQADAQANPTMNLDRDTSVDTQSSGVPVEYAFNIEDTRPPWQMEAHTHQGSSKTQQTPRVVKAYDEEVAPIEVPEVTEEAVDEDDEQTPMKPLSPSQDERSGADDGDETVSRGETAERGEVTPQVADETSQSQAGTRPASTPDNEPRLFQRHLQEMSEVMNSIDNAQTTSNADTLSANTFQEEEQVEAEDQNMVSMTPQPSLEEPEQKDLERSLTRSEQSQPEQHASRRILAKPMESSCPSCDIVNSDAASSMGGSSMRSNKYSYAKSRSHPSMEVTYTDDERLETPNEKERDAPELRQPTPTASEVDIITNESTNASETVPAEKEGDIEFFPTEDAAAPKDHDRSIDQEHKTLEPSQPTQRQCSLQCIDDDDDDSEEETGAVITLEDSRNSLWIIQPKEHRRKSSQNREAVQEDQNEDYDEYEPEGGSFNGKRRKPSDPDSGHGTRRSKGPSSTRNPSFQTSRPSSSLPRGRAARDGSVFDENGNPHNDYDEDEFFDEDNDGFYSTEDTNRRSSGISIVQTSESTFVPVDKSGNILFQEPPGSFHENFSNDNSGSMNPGSRDSHGSLNWTLTPINEERSRSQNMAELSGSSFHSCEENLPPPVSDNISIVEQVEQNSLDKYSDDEHPLQFHKSPSPSVGTPLNHIETPVERLEQKAVESEHTLGNISTLDNQSIIEPTYLKNNQVVSGDFSSEVPFEKCVDDVAQPQIDEADFPLEDGQKTLYYSTVNLHLQPSAKSGNQSESSQEVPIEGVPDPVALRSEIEREEQQVVNSEKTSQLFYQEKTDDNASMTNYESLKIPVEAEPLANIEPEVKSPMADQQSVGFSNPSESYYQPSSNNTRHMVADEGVTSNEGFSSKSMEMLDEPGFHKAGIQISAGEIKSERYSVDVPRASTTEKCIITKQRVKPVALDEFTQVMETPRYGPQEQANEKSFSFCEGPAAVYDANSRVLGNQTVPGDHFGSAPQAEEPDYENFGAHQRGQWWGSNGGPLSQGSLQSLSDMQKSQSSSKLKLTRKSTQSLSDGMSFASQSVRGSHLAIDMRPDSTPSLNLPLNMEKSIINEAGLASIPTTPNGHLRQNNPGPAAMRSSSFKPRSTTPGNSQMYMSNSKLGPGSVINTPRTPATLEMSLASPRDMSMVMKNVVSSQSLERQIRVTRVRATSRRGGDENSRGSRLGSKSRGTSKNSHSPSKRGSVSTFGKKNTFSMEGEVAFGDEGTAMARKEKRSNDMEIVAQVGHGYVIGKDIPLIGPF